MRIELCRHCGEEMNPCESCEKCPVCNEPMRLFCPNCNSESEIQVHQHLKKVFA